ncbi:unnamed protein product [Linum trigynum]|uniref:CCHC-type domain-containing protein n=1 Tax=Linum trigynum TaxID=586398 RepID=A0AAV2GRJ7_9ROSI
MTWNPRKIPTMEGDQRTPHYRTHEPYLRKDQSKEGSQVTMEDDNQGKAYDCQRDRAVDDSQNPKELIASRGDSTSKVMDVVDGLENGKFMDTLVSQIQKDLVLAEEEPLLVEEGDYDTIMERAVDLLGVVGRYMSEKKPNLKSLKIALSKAWNLQKNFQIKDLEDQMLAFQFIERSNRDKVLNGGPWHHDNNLLIFKPADLSNKQKKEDFFNMGIWMHVMSLPNALRTTEMAHKIGARLGKLIWVDNRPEGMWDDFLRLRVEKDIRKPIKPELNLNLKGEIKGFEIRYEKLPLFCFNCGLIGHPKTNCQIERVAESSKYGTHIRVGPLQNKPWRSKLEKEEQGKIWVALRAKFDRELFNEKNRQEEKDVRSSLLADKIAELQRQEREATIQRPPSNK